LLDSNSRHPSTCVLVIQGNELPWSVTYPHGSDMI